jgi:uncharacterized protein
MTDLILLVGASVLAGCIDAMVGGGGLVLLPALFAVHPVAAPATLLGTNKGAAVWGTAFAASQYARRVDLRWASLSVGVACALVGSFAGAWAVTLVDPSGLRKALPFILAAVLIYTLKRKDLGRTHAPRWHGPREALALGLIGAVIGLYDGFFGPGTGSFFVFLLVRVLGYDFLHGSASAKLLNLATNAAAIAIFSWKGHVWWQVALLLGAANVAGSLLGTRLALQHGSCLIRWVFIGVVSVLIVKTGYDGFF